MAGEGVGGEKGVVELGGIFHGAQRARVKVGDGKIAGKSEILEADGVVARGTVEAGVGDGSHENKTSSRITAMELVEKDADNVDGVGGGDAREKKTIGNGDDNNVPI